MSFILNARQTGETLGSDTPLRNTLYGKPSIARPINCFAVCCNYAGMYWEPTTREKPMRISSEMDLASFQDWAGQFDSSINMHILENEEVTTENLVTILRRVGSEVGCSVVYLSGHAMPTGHSFVFLPVDCIENNEVRGDRGLSSEVMRALLLAQDVPDPSTLLLVTEFCFVDNFLDLPYMLCLEPNKEPRWSDPNKCAPPTEESVRDHGRKILHFAGAAAMKQTFSTKVGGRFTRAFCRISPSDSMSLASRVRQIQRKLDKMPLAWGSKYQQQIQLYSSHKWDLSSTDTLESCISEA